MTPRRKQGEPAAALDTDESGSESESGSEFDSKSGSELASGWEGLSEERADGTIAPSPELEEALREASEAVAAGAQATQATGRSSADEVTLEALSRELDAARVRAEEDAQQLAEFADLSDRHLRLQAEFENFRKRSAREREEMHRYGHQNWIKDLLPTVDNLERAIDHAKGSTEGDFEGVFEGVALVHRELVSALAKNGVTALEPKGEVFDPNLHEAVAQVPSEEAAPNTVIEVLEKGYCIHDRLLRPARVLVAVAAAGEAAKEET